jgi:hypothetical protein
MSETLLSVRPAFGTWKRGLLHVDYGLGVLEEIRRTVQEGFHKIPHGGVETGGLLYGKWDGTVLTVSAWRPLQCEHPLGPRFQLSGADEAALATQLATETPELENYQVVGWFASHSRGALQLRGPDVDLHAKYFPEPWQPILLLCASRNQPMQAAFYSRLDETVAVGSEVTPFEVIPNPTAVPRRTRRAPVAGTAAAALEDGIARPEASDSIRILATQMGTEPAQVIAPNTVSSPSTGWVPLEPAAASPWASRGYERVEGPPATIQPAMEPAPALLPPQAAPEPTDFGEHDASFANLGDALEGEEDPPKFTAPATQDRTFPWKRLAWAAVWLCVAAIGVYAIPKLSLPSTTATARAMSVKVSEVAGAARGQLVVRWDLIGAAGAVLRNGEITVVDGAGERGVPVRQSYALSPKELRSGALTYWPQTKHVDVTVTVETGRPGSGEALVGKASFGSGTEPAGKQNTGDIEALNALREQLRVQRARGRQLERQLEQKR